MLCLTGTLRAISDLECELKALLAGQVEARTCRFLAQCVDSSCAPSEDSAAALHSVAQMIEVLSCCLVALHREAFFPKSISDVGFSFRFLTRGAFAEGACGRRVGVAWASRGICGVWAVYGRAMRGICRVWAVYGRGMRGICGVAGLRGTSVRGGCAWASRGICGVRRGMRGICGVHGRLTGTSVRGGVARGSRAICGVRRGMRGICGIP